MRLLDSGSEGVQEEAAGALWILAEDNDANQAAIAAAGGIPPLVRLLDSGSEAVLQEAVGVLLSLAVNSAANRAAIAAAGGIPPLVRLRRSGDAGFSSQGSHQRPSVSSCANS